MPKVRASAAEVASYLRRHQRRIVCSLAAEAAARDADEAEVSVPPSAPAIMKAHRDGDHFVFVVLNGEMRTDTRVRHWETWKHGGFLRVFGEKVDHYETKHVTVSSGMEVTLKLPWSIVDHEEVLSILVTFLREVVEHGLGKDFYVSEGVAAQLLNAVYNGSAVLGLRGSQVKFMGSSLAPFDEAKKKLTDVQENNVQRCEMYV
eukprot:m.14166 g.14166  ORF g.14166 m.14166 type:complete len:204 (-) comp7058_c0_seq1:200-811(-)